MKKYEEYKDSGVEWIEEIPQDWVITKFGFEVQIKRGAGYQYIEQTDDDEYEPVIRISDFSEFLPLKAKPIEELNIYRVKEGDILIAGTGATAGKSILVKKEMHEMVHSYNALRLFSKGESNKYFFYCLNSHIVDEQKNLSFTGSAQPFLDVQRIANLLFAKPKSVDEQTAIANYLDRKTAQIDNLIAKKERLIELLQEERTAIINQAVTKGLDPNLPMKDSGIEWLGEIPEHWEVKRIKNVAFLKSGENITSEQITEDGEYPVFGGNGLRGYFKNYTHEGNYVLIGRQGALCGNIKYAKNKFWASEHAIVCHLYEGYNWIWFGKLLETMNLNQYSQSAAQPGLAVNEIKNLTIPVPNVNEQNNIETYISLETKRMDLLLDKILQEIDLLKEYKTALISEVVTGKVKVFEN